MVEVLRKEVERMHLLKGVSKRIEQLLSVEEPIVIPAPTLASLEFRDLIPKVDFLDFIPIETKAVLTNQFITDIANMKEEIQKGKDSTIFDKIKSLITSLNTELTQTLKDKTTELEEELEITKQMRAKPLADFMTEFYEDNMVNSWSYVEARISNNVSSECTDFIRYVNRKINQASSKDEAQDTMGESSTVEYGNNCFNFWNDFYRISRETS